MRAGMVLIGGTCYAGEMKKSVFTVLNYLLAAAAGNADALLGQYRRRDGDTALFFGLSGTGKTTLSADPDRTLIGDDEHGWCEHGIFNFEGGCYAKIIQIVGEAEPEIYGATRSSRQSLKMWCSTREPSGTRFDDGSLTENTRAAYPLQLSFPMHRRAASAGTRQPSSCSRPMRSGSCRRSRG